MSEITHLPNYENIDAEELAKKIGLNVKHIPILINSFVEESKTILEEMEKAISEKEYPQIEHTAHSIKGSSGNLKFNEMYELAKRMEFAAKELNSDFAYLQAYEQMQRAIGSISLA